MEHIVLEEPPALAADTHLMCWGYEDQKETSSEGLFLVKALFFNLQRFFVLIGVVPRSVVFDGDCLYVTMTTGKELLKLGTGTNGTLRLTEMHVNVHVHVHSQNGRQRHLPHYFHLFSSLVPIPIL